MKNSARFVHLNELKLRVPCFLMLNGCFTFDQGLKNGITHTMTDESF
jgi:hypothetical protein